MEPILTIDNLNSFGGNMLRQGDKSQLKYRLRDVGNKNLAISSKPCQVRMYGRNYTTVVYETTATVSSDNTVTFTIDKVLPKGTFYLEFTVGDYIFPTDHKEFFEITPSGKGMESNIIEIVGVDTVVRKAVDLINKDPSLIIGDGTITIDKLNTSTINKLNTSAVNTLYTQGTLRALEIDFKQFNLVNFDVNGVPQGSQSNSTVNADGSIRVDSGGYFFPQVNIIEGLLNNDKMIAGLQILEDTAQASIQFEFRDGVTQIALYDFHDAKNGWIVTDVLDIPPTATNVRIRVDNRGKDGHILFTNYFIQNSDILRPIQADVIKSVSENTNAINNLNVQLNERIDLKRRIPYKFPQDFRWKDNPLNGHIFTDGEGDFEVVGFDVSSYKPSGKYYYVDYSNGNDTNDGLTLSSAFKTVGKAKSMTDSVGAYLAEGLYPRSGTLFNDPITKPFALVAVEGHDVWYTSHSNSIFAPVRSMPGVYHATRSALGTFIADKKHVTDGLPYDLKQLPRASEVATEPGSYAFVGDKLYVHLIDGREPDADVILPANGNLTVAQGGNDLYLEGINFVGGQSPIHVQNTSTGLRPRVFGKDCNFLYSGTENNDAVMLQGVELSIFQNCKAGRGLKDGFNYHWRNNIVPKSIEINCQGFDNGNDTDDNDQGSTTHDGGSIIRINGAYYRNKGANLAEDATVGDSPTESLNLGCVGFESFSPNPLRAVNFDCYDGVKMWLDGCIGYGSPYDLSQRGAGDLKVRNSKFDKLVQPDGQSAYSTF